MDKKIAKNKKLRRKYVAALAGAAIMAGTSLHGISAASAAATDKPSITPPVTTEQTSSLDKNKDKRHGDWDKRDHRHDRYDHHRYNHERWADRGQAFNQRISWYNDSWNKIQMVIDNASPVDIVMAAADNLGFDVNNDTFTLLSQNGSQSIVRVVHNNINYDITVDHLPNNNWRVTFVNQIQ